MENEELKQHSRAIADLEKKLAVTDTKLDAVTQNIIEIKTNHLVHINDQLTAVNLLLNNKFDTVTKSFAEVYKQIGNLKVTDATRAPGSTLLQKIIEYVILAVVAAGMFLILDKR